MTEQDSSSRIAIRFGSSSKGAHTSRRSAPSSALGKRHRPTFDDDAESNGSDTDDAQHESITHFGAEGAENLGDEIHNKIERTSGDRDSADSKTDAPKDSDRNTLTGHERAGSQETEETLKYGLTVSKKPKENEDEQRAHSDCDEETRKPKTADDEAIDALMGKDSTKQRLLHRTEDDAYRDAASNAPEVDDLATYDAIPVEGFGASLLKGQGWDGKMRGPKTKEIKRRPNGMGLGAKKLKAEEDLGGWDSKGKSERRPRLDEYRRESDKDRSRRVDRYRDSYKNERDRERDRDGHRSYGRDRDAHRRHDRDSRR